MIEWWLYPGIFDICRPQLYLTVARGATGQLQRMCPLRNYHLKPSIDSFQPFSNTLLVYELSVDVR